eukprot:TRINITY_DN21692_c0_g2_i1.p1 TRINITY_DN21692_c0_g2~~TRINITY_DN21692_c0_g2_i1.p1  ORF type:complete len:1064 (-),score=174.88 TRINITY_DN21692_c0_g2_i1:171-3362(-)
MRPRGGVRVSKSHESTGRPLTGLLSRTASTEVFGASLSSSASFAASLGGLGSTSSLDAPRPPQRRFSASTSLPNLPPSQPDVTRATSSKSGPLDSSAELPPLGRSLETIDRRIARDFERKEAMRTSGMTPQAVASSRRGAAASHSAGAGRGENGSRACASEPAAVLTRPSTVVRHENFKKERYAEHIEAKAADSQKGAARAGSASGADSAGGAHIGEQEIEAMRKAFNESVEVMNNEITDAWASIRMTDMADGLAGKETLAQRQARRRREAAREAELRRARKKEQDARDPKRKVALRLENKRRFEMDTISEANIPLRAVEVAGETGVERIPLVDVRMLQSRCQGLDENGVSVAALLERKRYFEKAERMSASTPSAAAGSTSGTFEPRFSDQSWEDRYELAATLKNASHAAEMLRCFGHMRGALPKGDAARVAALRRTVGEVQHDESDRLARMRRSMSGESSKKWRSVQDYWGDIDTHVQKKIAHLAIVPPVLGARSSSITSSPSRHGSRSPGSTARDKVAGRSISRSSNKLGKPCPERARRWSLLRAAAALCGLLHRVRRQNRLADIIKAVLVQQNKRSEIQNAMRLFKQKIMTVQEYCRNFFVLTCRRVEKNEALWKQIEERYLPHFVTRYQEQLIEDKVKALGGKRTSQERKKAEEFYRKVGELAQIDWKAFSIAPAVRRAILRRLYVQQLRRKARSSKSFATAAREALRAHKELQGFLLNFGVTQAESDNADVGSSGDGSGSASGEANAGDVAAPVEASPSSVRRRTSNVVAAPAAGPVPATSRKTPGGMSPSAGASGATMGGSPSAVGASATVSTSAGCAPTAANGSSASLGASGSLAAAQAAAAAHVTIAGPRPWWYLTEDVVFTLIAFVAQTFATATGLEATMGEDEAAKFRSHWNIHPGVKDNLAGGELFYRRPVETVPVDLSGCTGKDLNDQGIVFAVVKRFDMARMEQSIARREHNPSKQPGADAVASSRISVPPMRTAGASGNTSGQRQAGGDRTTAFAVEVEVERSMDLEEVLASLTPRLGEVAGRLPADELDEAEMRDIPQGLLSRENVET